MGDAAAGVDTRPSPLQDLAGGVPGAVLNEVELLRELRHTNIVALRDVFVFAVYDLLSSPLSEVVESVFLDAGGGRVRVAQLMP
eukprot:gene40294-44262_t